MKRGAAGAVLEPRTASRQTSAPVQPSSSAGLLWVPVALAFVLALFPLFFEGWSPRLSYSLVGTSAALLAFAVSDYFRVKQAARILTYKVVIRRVHWVQLLMHSSIYAYWGWYWREVYSHIPLIAAQIVFMYAFDMLLCWARRDTWILGFGQIPIVLSTNLFLWFRDDYFYLQFALLAVAVVAKEFFKWQRDGRSAHIFNPSSLPLSVFAVVLIATNATNMTWGIDISQTLHRPPYIYLEIFFLGLIVQSLFRVTLVTLFAAAALYACNLAYTKLTGDYNFIDSNIPVSVFLGLHLLITDPATSPRKDIGKMIFGALYGASVFGMYRLLAAMGAPEFYDKLLCVPALNLCVRWLDRLSFAVETRISSFDWPIWRSVSNWSPQRSNLAWMGVWASFFVVMLSTGFLSKGADHPGSDPEFWRSACNQGRVHGCTNWVRVLSGSCDANSRADCSTLADLLNAGAKVPRQAAIAGVAYGRACDLGSQDACTKLVQFTQSDGKNDFEQACSRGDGASCFVLGSLYSGGNGVPRDDDAAFRLFTRSCDLQWWRGCGRLGVSYLVGQGTPRDTTKALQLFEAGCKGQNAASCVQAANVYSKGPPSMRNAPLAAERSKQACEFGLPTACIEPSR